MEIQYYQEDGLFCACINHGHDGIFIYRLYDENPTWEFVQPGTVSWDSLHQEIYRNYKFTPCKINEVYDLPPLPQIPKVESIQWKDNFLPDKETKASGYPNIRKLLKEFPDQSITLFILLFEDRYETALGDGKFLYYKGKIYFSESDAADYSEKNTSDEKYGPKYHVRSIKIRLENDSINPVDFEVGMFEHFELIKILEDLELLLCTRLQ